ncbi:MULTISPECIES: Mu transposase C-terminal domain-containing protein [Deefgea]|uniref:DDE-type integrase/transposase/recombinase n=1 Tax=Deefgea chitinilytica TaxID=570276 RepID=A0ABS2CI04_9NEIS|nr:MULTISPECIES: Mu transposase C-terminal domain-containing protein [Deefgea]MBM5573006.1 DDE-type integrase/transposase/recombinase [Deefgea chitinilytica]MBM9890242.1 transposase [Deefgea sp. CFH1-16]
MAEQFVIGDLLDGDGHRYCVARILDNGTARLIDLDDGTYREVTDLWMTRIARHAKKDSHADLGLFSERHWDKALQRFEIIAPILATSGDRIANVLAAAERAKVDRATIFRWMQRYQDTGTISSLVRKPRSDQERGRINTTAEMLVLKVLKEHFLTDQKQEITKSYRDLEMQCRNANVPPPSYSTFYRRINALSTVVRISARDGKSGKRRMKQVVGRFPRADFPYSVLQIDHTLVDIRLVDEVKRLPLPRPYITVAIDVFSRMVVGYYISFDPPGVLGTAMCIAMSILPKAPFLHVMGLDYDYPCQGFPKKIHVDNAKEFRGNALKKACEEYGIDLEFRPVRTPNYGGHIERLMGTLMSEIHALPGTTRSRSTELGDYKPEEKAAMTMQDFELWFANLVIGHYHHEVHKGIELPPIEKFKEGIFGCDNSPGIGLPLAPTSDEAIQKLKLDFMPMAMRTVQREGIAIDSIHYQADVLRPWVEAVDPAKPSAKRKFIIRRDPRDISCIWFFDPKLKRYFRIPYLNPLFPAISIWELREIKAYLKQRGKEAKNESVLFSAYNEMRRIESQSVEETKRVRVQTAKKNSRAQKVAQTGLKPHPPVIPPNPQTVDDDDDDLILQTPFKVEPL